MNRQFDDLMLGSLELFCLAAERGGFTAAANFAGLTPAAVSRTVARLEERLGVRLFVRTTRQIRLSEAGQAYYAQCRQALHQLVEAEREVSGQQVTPSGLLRISTPTTYGHYRLLPLLPEFRARYPDIRVEVHVSNRNIDFAAEGYDLAVRVRAPADSTLIARHLEDAELVLVATPDYLRRRGEPKTLEDLTSHDCIQFELPSSGRTIPWLFRRDGQDIELPPPVATPAPTTSSPARRWPATARASSRPIASSSRRTCARGGSSKCSSPSAAAPAPSTCSIRSCASCRCACAPSWTS